MDCMMSHAYLPAVRAECTKTKVGPRKAQPEDCRKNTTKTTAESSLLEFRSFWAQLSATSPDVL